jgi:hypothetical protein
LQTKTPHGQGNADPDQQVEKQDEAALRLRVASVNQDTLLQL